MQRLEFELFADHFQFYLQDEAADGNLGDAWDKGAVARLLAVAPGTIGIGTVRNMDVPVTVEILESEPEPDFASWDHVTECSIAIPTGKIVVAGCMDYFPDAARIDVSPGSYRARVSYCGLDSVSGDGLDGDDRYRVQLWPGSTLEPTVLKDRAA